MPRNTKALERRALMKQSRAKLATRDVTAISLQPLTRRTTPQSAQQIERKLEAAQERQAALSDALQKSTSIGDRTQTDLMAMTLGTSFHEAANFFIRWMAEASQKEKGDASFWYRNVDLLQALPGALGMATYLINTMLLHSTETALRTEQKIYLPPGWRIGLNESAKLLTTLGLSNVFRALRYRWADSVDEARDTAAAQAEQHATLQKARDEIAALHERLRKLQSNQT